MRYFLGPAVTSSEIRAIRARHRIKQIELAEAAGISLSTVKRVENDYEDKRLPADTEERILLGFERLDVPLPDVCPDWNPVEDRSLEDVGWNMATFLGPVASLARMRRAEGASHYGLTDAWAEAVNDLYKKYGKEPPLAGSESI